MLFVRSARRRRKDATGPSATGTARRGAARRMPSPGGGSVLGALTHLHRRARHTSQSSALVGAALLWAVCGGGVWGRCGVLCGVVSALSAGVAPTTCGALTHGPVGLSLTELLWWGAVWCRQVDRGVVRAGVAVDQRGRAGARGEQAAGAAGKGQGARGKRREAAEGPTAAMAWRGPPPLQKLVP